MSIKTLQREHEMWNYEVPETNAKKGGCCHGDLDELSIMLVEEVNREGDYGIRILITGKEPAESSISVEFEADDARTLANWLLLEADKAEKLNIAEKRGGNQ